MQAWNIAYPEAPKAAKLVEEFRARRRPSETGMDYMHKWTEELEIIASSGPFTKEELAKLSPQQSTDYFYVTSWILRQEGEGPFVAARDELRQLLLHRLQRGQRLNPLEDECDGPSS
jgi:hypothetical protein